MKETPNITQARLDQIIIKRSEEDETKVGSVYFHGKYIDENGDDYHTDVAPGKQVGWDNLPENWRNALLPILRAMGKQFNLEFADEDVETFEI